MGKRREIIDHDTLEPIDEYPIIEMVKGSRIGPKCDWTRFTITLDDEPTDKDALEDGDDPPPVVD